MQWETPSALFARRAFTAHGWQRDVVLQLEGGRIAAIEPGKPAGGMPSFDLILPGFSNVHAHAFQRAMVGLTEMPSPGGKSNFWSWREVMYRFTLQLTPEQIEAIAQHFYIELLKHGYTSVGEFHYLHQQADGTRYANPAELSHRIHAAAQASGIHLTLLPVMYETANFGGVPALDEQRRFLHNADEYLALLAELKKLPDITLGIAPHSLRAVTPDSLKHILETLPSLGLGDCPIHMHAAEQVKEVEDCLAATGQRPVEWLLNNTPVDARWCLIHATHMNDTETRALAARGAVAGLCPTTEANLGDGIFPALTYLAADGRFGVGSDSNVCVSPFEELRQLEYSQRLQHRLRNVLSGTHSTGRTLFANAATSGAQALGIDAGALDVGKRADLIALDTASHPFLADKQEDAILDTVIFNHMPTPVRDVFVAGRHVVKAGHHAAEAASQRAFSATLQALAP